MQDGVGLRAQIVEPFCLASDLCHVTSVIVGKLLKFSVPQFLHWAWTNNSIHLTELL